jgi:hypothetical protein
MTRKRKADVEAEEQLFARDAKKIRNPLVQKTHFRTVEESGIDVRTTISGRESNATEIPINNTVPPDAIPTHGSSRKDDEKKKKTQVCSILLTYATCFTNTHLPEFTTPGRFRALLR